MGRIGGSFEAYYEWVWSILGVLREYSMYIFGQIRSVLGVLGRVLRLYWGIWKVYWECTLKIYSVLECIMVNTRKSENVCLNIAVTLKQSKRQNINTIYRDYGSGALLAIKNVTNRSSCSIYQ